MKLYFVKLKFGNGQEKLFCVEAENFDSACKITARYANKKHKGKWKFTITVLDENEVIS